MAARPPDLIPVVQRSYDLCAGLYEHINRFPRAQRTLLGRVILEDGLEMLQLITVANRRIEKSETLAQASGRLDALRITLRLGKHMGFLSNGGYERLSGVADEVGRMLGGWIKYEGAVAQRAATGAPAAAAPLEGVASATPRPRGSAALHGDGGSAEPVAPKRTGGVRYKLTSATVEKCLHAKLAHPESVVFVRVGAFCQTFFEDAAFCGRTLRLMVRRAAGHGDADRESDEPDVRQPLPRSP